MKFTDWQFIDDALKSLDAATDGGDVALAEVPRTPYRPMQPKPPRTVDPDPRWWRLVALAAWLFPLVVWVLVWRRSVGG